MAVAPTQKLIRVQVYADILCGWSYIQKRTLEAAIDKFRAQHRDWNFLVVWKPFYLCTELPHGMDKIEFYEQYVPRFQETRPRMRAAALPHGILMSLTGRTGPSRSAHILSRLALDRLGPSVQNSVMEELFAGHFDLGRDISDEEWLVEVGRRNGLPEETVMNALGSMEAGAEVDREAEVAKSAAVRSVPCVIVEETFIDSYNGVARFDYAFENIRRKQGHVG